MKKIVLLLALFALNGVLAHDGKHILGKSIFDKNYKYRINTSDSHIGHFYIKKARSSRKGNEKLKVEHTIHLENDVVRKFNIKYTEKTSLLSYDYDMEGFTYFFNFFIKDEVQTASHPGSMVIYNKAENSFTVNNVSLDPVDDSETAEEHSHPQ